MADAVMADTVPRPEDPKGLDGAFCPPEAQDQKGTGKGLALKWDNNPEIRQRLRSGKNLLVHFDAKMNIITNTTVEKTMANVKVNSMVLEPVCRMIRENGLTVIDDLEHEVKQIFSMYNMLVAPKTVISQAWSVRYLIQVLKGSVKSEKGNKEKIKRCPKDRQSVVRKSSNRLVC